MDDNCLSAVFKDVLHAISSSMIQLMCSIYEFEYVDPFGLP